MRLNKATSHAIRILIDCARADGELIKVAMLSERLGITQQNVFKIVNLLTKAGLIEAMRGRNGGVRLARPATDIRIGDVVRASEVTHVEIDEGASRKRKGQPAGGVNQVLDDALEAFIEVLDQHSLADMARSRGPADLPPRRKPASSAKSSLATPVRVRRPLQDGR